MKILSLTSVLAVLILSVSGLRAERAGWSEDYDASLKRAKAEKKLTVLDFTGSDWCGWCVKLDKEVFSQPEFEAYAKENLVLVDLDFPKKKSQDATIKKQNEKLAQQYKIEGFPTIIVLDADGKKIGTLGYMPGGPKAFIAELEKLKS